MNIYICKHCGNIITKLTDMKVPVVCCGEPMQLLEAGVTEASLEKHIPAVSVEGSLVSVQIGSAPHPMIQEHYIEWVIAETDQGVQIKWLSPEQEPKVTFKLAEGEKLKAVLEYCNIHGLWKKEI